VGVAIGAGGVAVGGVKFTGGCGEYAGSGGGGGGVYDGDEYAGGGGGGIGAESTTVGRRAPPGGKIFSFSVSLRRIPAADSSGDLHWTQIVAVSGFHP
jgi:hypothetical protein